MDNVVCPECRKPTQVVVDHAAGDVVCTECGLILQAHVIDESSEWRTFSNESASDDPVRVGAPSNPLLTDGGLSTIIVKPDHVAKGDSMPTLSRWENRIPDPDRTLILAFQTIATIADRLGLVSTIKDRASELYKKIEDLKAMRGKIRRRDAILAACVYIATKQETKPRTVKEISAAANGVPVKEIWKAVMFVETQLKAAAGTETISSMSVDMGTIKANDFLRRFCSHLGISNNAVRATDEAVKKSDELDITRKNPTSVAAAAIYMISQVSEEKIPPKDIARVAGVSVGTVWGAYKDLYPHAAKIIPEWFLKDKDIKNLPAL